MEDPIAKKIDPRAVRQDKIMYDTVVYVEETRQHYTARFTFHIDKSDEDVMLLAPGDELDAELWDFGPPCSRNEAVVAVLWRNTGCDPYMTCNTETDVIVPTIIALERFHEGGLKLRVYQHYVPPTEENPEPMGLCFAPALNFTPAINPQAWIETIALCAEILDEDILKGVPCKPSRCPVALALTRAFRSIGWDAGVAVERHQIIVAQLSHDDRPFSSILTLPMPPSLRRFMLEFDSQRPPVPDPLHISRPKLPIIRL